MKAKAAYPVRKFKDEIVPLKLNKRTGLKISIPIISPADTTMEKLAKLKPAFVKKNGTVTAGNASGINEVLANSLHLQIKCKESDLSESKIFHQASAELTELRLGPIPSSRKHWSSRTFT